MKGAVSISVGRKNFLEETLRVGNVVVPSSFVGNQRLEVPLDGEVDLWDSQS